MKEEILAQIRSFVFPDVCTKVSRMLDQYRESIEQSSPDEKGALFDDQIGHLTRALTMISKVPDSTEGARMARGIAEEAISAISSDQ